jgi:uncharacterized protein
MQMNEHGSTTPNRLLHEKSPYLLQHAYNPVDWYPWGGEAFQKARLEDKPIFLSIGYSTCYWCHVMEREVFENESIATLMNRLVVCIKVDREERPDIDRVYMSALQAMSGSGGWPMSMFLTPDLKPFFGATYIPPTDQYGRPGFPQILQRIHEVWTNDRSKVIDAGQRINEYLQESASASSQPRSLGSDILESGFSSFRNSYDSVNKGFGSAPKFPRPSVLNFLFRYYARTKNQQALDMCLETLRAMARGGMHDHLGGGFHRYATDAHWNVPHFEKMLYDQAQLAISYLEAFLITRDEVFADVARDICDYVLRDLSHPGGGFYSAEDAESAPDELHPKQKEEGAFYVWTRNEIEKLLTAREAEVFTRHFDVEHQGNVLDDPHGVFKGKNILRVSSTVSEIATQLALSESEVAEIVESCRAKLLTARFKRPHCHLDDKILTSWNGLMISALARASQVLGEEKYLNAAEQSARFVLTRMCDESTHTLLHRYRDGEARFDGQLDDFAFFVQGLLDLYESCFDIDWLSSAMTFTSRMNDLFYDDQNGGYFDTNGHDPSILVRTKEWYDGAEPSGNSIALLNLLRLAHLINDAEGAQKAEASLRFFGEHIAQQPHATPQFLAALDASLSKSVQIILAGSLTNPLTQALLQETRRRFIPNKVMLLADGARGQEVLSGFAPFIAGLKMVNEKPTAYVCENFTCQLPTSEPAMLATLLEALSPARR